MNYPTELEVSQANELSREGMIVLCLADAVTLHHTNPEAARTWALQSLKYSVGVFHPDYIKATGA